MAKIIQLMREGSEMIGSDGIMYVDGRHNLQSIKNDVRERNARFAKNFPHKIADAFKIYRGPIRSGIMSPVYILDHNVVYAQ